MGKSLRLSSQKKVHPISIRKNHLERIMSRQLKNYGTQCSTPLHRIDGNVSPIDISIELDGDFMNKWNLKVGRFGEIES
jgi:hypothetical protein